MIKNRRFWTKIPATGHVTPSLTPNAPPFRPKEEGADHVRLEFPLAGVARKTLHLKVAGMTCKLQYLWTRHCSNTIDFYISRQEHQVRDMG